MTTCSKNQDLSTELRLTVQLWLSCGIWLHSLWTATVETERHRTTITSRIDSLITNILVIIINIFFSVLIIINIIIIIKTFVTESVVVLKRMALTSFGRCPRRLHARVQFAFSLMNCWLSCGRRNFLWVETQTNSSRSTVPRSST